MNGRATGKAMEIGGTDTTWKTRRRVWIFGFSPESVISILGPNITDGESFRVYDVFDAGVPIPTGESETSRCLTWTDTAYTHFLAIERTMEDLTGIARVLGPRATLHRWAFWLEPDGNGANHKCVYAIRPGTQLVDALILRERLARKTRGLFAMTVKNANLKAIRDDIESDDLKEGR